MKRTTWFGLLLAILAIPAIAYNPTVGPGLHHAEFLAGQTIHAGWVDVYNSQQEVFINVAMEDGWLIKEIHVHYGFEPPYSTKKGNAVPGKYPYKMEYKTPAAAHSIVLNLQDDYDFSWGQPWAHLRYPYVAIHADVVKLDAYGEVIAEEGAWAFGEPLEGDQWGWQVQYELTHPQIGHFRDSPVGGAGMDSPTFKGKTGSSGEFPYFPGENADFYIGKVKLGKAFLDKHVTPLDFFAGSDTSDPRVINMARLLQSLDIDGEPRGGITYTPEIEVCLEFAVENAGIETLDFTNDDMIDDLITDTLVACADVEGLSLVSVSAEDAKINLDKSLDSTMFRKNVSKTPGLTSSKSKLNIMGVWFPALKANGDLATYIEDDGTVIEGIPYYDENSDLIRVATEAKPIVLTYTDGVEETGFEDIFAAISRDDGNTFKRKNLSRAADKSSFELANGEDYYGQTKKPVFQVKGNNILVAWTSKFCKGGKPTYAITTCDDPDTEEIVEVADPVTGLCRITCHGDGDNEVCESDYPYDDPFFEEDIWGVGGPQRSVDYTEQDYPEVGEIPYSCVWVARGTILTDAMLTKAPWNSLDSLDDPMYVVGDIVWFKPERLTSGRRDANQAFMGGADGAGFAIAWQEDPEGLRPGTAAGPGPGWGGATTNHKTDIWYSYITMPNFARVDLNFESGGDPEHYDTDLAGRQKALVPMSLPVRLSDNDTVNTDNLMVELDGDGWPVGATPADWIPTTNLDASSEDADGTHAYGYMVEGLCADFYEFVNYQDETKRVCITDDGRLLDGDTGASRPNLFLQTYTKTITGDNPATPEIEEFYTVKSAWAIMAYEETKGAGVGPPDHEEDEGPYGDVPVPEEGKNAIYLSFDFQTPPVVSAGKIINFPERDADGNLVYLREVLGVDEYGNTIYGDRILDHQDPAQPILAYENARRPRFILQGKAAIPTDSVNRTVLLVLYKEGVEGHGRPSDIMMRRVAAPLKGNPYAPANMICNGTAVADNGQTVCVDGAMNMSTVTPTRVTDSMGDPEQDDAYGAVKVVAWEQTVENFDELSWVNPYEDARAHRGQIRGDLVTMGYSYTPNWAAARNGNDQYDFYVRRSFDGGVTWTTDSAGLGVTNCEVWTDPVTKEKTEQCWTFGPGEFEQARNLSQLKNAKSSVIEPRIVCPPGSIKIDGVWTGIAEDKQNKNVCYVAYGTSTNPKKDPVTGEQEAPVPEDLYYSYTQDRGETFVDIAWDVNPDSSGHFVGETVYRWDFMAKGDPEQGEVQLRMTPDGSRFYASWLDEGEEGSDIVFRRIMPITFPVNLAPPATE